MTLRLPHPTALCALLGLVTGSASAQVRFDARVGAMFSTRLVNDSLGTEALTLRQNVAPSLALAIDSRVGPTDRFGIIAGVSRSSLILHAASGDRALLVLTTWTPTAALTHEISRTLAASVSVGAILYDPDATLGSIFADNLPVRPIAGVSLHWRHLITTHTAVGVDLAYDVHGFMSQALSNQGFTGQWIVHRATIGITLGHRYDAPSP